MQAKKSAIIIGGGLMGVTTAYALARRNISVTLLEAAPAPGFGASYANACMLSPSTSSPWNAPGVERNLIRSLIRPSTGLGLRITALPSLWMWGLRFLRNSTRRRHTRGAEANFKLARYSTLLTREWRDALELEYEAADCGTLVIFRDHASLSATNKKMAFFGLFGMRSQLMDTHAVVTLEPSLSGASDKIAGGIFLPDDALGDAHKFVQDLTRVTQSLGAAFLFNKKVSRIECSNGRVSGVWTGAEFFSADNVILAAGVDSVSLLRSLGIRLPVAPAKGYSTTFQDKGGDRPLRPIIDFDRHAGVIPLRNRIRLVGAAEFAGYDKTINETYINNMIASYNELYPGQREAFAQASQERWAGLRPMSADGVPFIGESKIKGLYLNTGQGALGWTMAAGSASLLSDLLCGANPAIEPLLYRASR